jgi:MinD-like ATPase involved in chromosome partitioning or flagellar assembly
LYPRVYEGGDRGTPIVVAEPEASAARALRALADRVVAALESPAAR